MVSKNLSLEKNLQKIDEIAEKETFYSLKEYLVRAGRLIPEFDKLAKVLYQRVFRMYKPDLCSRNKEAFAHSVISHSFMDFCEAYGTSLPVFVGDNLCRKMYDKFAEINNIPLEVRELGWQEFLND